MPYNVTRLTLIPFVTTKKVLITYVLLSFGTADGGFLLSFSIGSRHFTIKCSSQGVIDNEASRVNSFNPKFMF